MYDIAIIVGCIAIGLSLLRLFTSVANPGKMIQKKFVALGDMKGKTIAQITQAVNLKPSLVTNNSDGTKIVKWQMTWFYISLLFDKDGKLVKIVEQKVNP